MLGRGDRAMILLQSIPMLIQRSEGGNPDAMRALPLSWDALLISGALTFLLGQLPTYRRIRAAVVTSVNTLPPEVGLYTLSPLFIPWVYLHFLDRRRIRP